MLFHPTDDEDEDWPGECGQPNGGPPKTSTSRPPELMTVLVTDKRRLRPQVELRLLISCLRWGALRDQVRGRWGGEGVTGHLQVKEGFREQLQSDSGVRRLAGRCWL